MSSTPRAPVDLDAPELVAACAATGTPEQVAELIVAALAMQGADWLDMEAQAELENARHLEQSPLVLFAHNGFDEWLAQRGA